MVKNTSLAHYTKALLIAKMENKNIHSIAKAFMSVLLHFEALIGIFSGISLALYEIVYIEFWRIT